MRVVSPLYISHDEGKLRLRYENILHSGFPLVRTLEKAKKQADEEAKEKRQHRYVFLAEGYGFVVMSYADAGIYFPGYRQVDIVYRVEV